MVKPIIIIGFLSLAISFSSYANDSDRIAQLEKEIQEIKLRLSKLESVPKSPSIPAQSVVSADGWKSEANWRSLTKDMSTTEVRKILGEPQRVDGGSITSWFYQNEGTVVFFNEKVTRWTEPRN